MMRALQILVFGIFSYASTLDIFIDSPVLLLDCRTHVSEEPEEYTTKLNSTEEPGKSTVKSQTTEEPIDPKDFYGAARDGDLSFINTAISQLSSNGLDLNWLNTDPDNYYGDHTALHIAIMNNHTNIVGALLDAGADPNVQTDWGATPVYYAAGEGRTGALKLLLDHGGDPNKVNKYRQSPLGTASAHGHVEAARMLIQAGANVDYANPSDGYTALHYAARYNHRNNNADVVLLLLQNGAQKDKQTKYGGMTPADLARDNGYDSVAQLIDDYQA